jgi:predicted NBD/HSP70 family sugar kinase
MHTPIAGVARSLASGGALRQGRAMFETLLAFDLGGTDLKVARIASDGSVHGFTKLPSRASEGAGPLFEVIASAAATVGEGASTAAAGFGSPG